MKEVTLEDKNIINLKLIECLLVLNLSIFENKSKYGIYYNILNVY